MSVCLSFSLPLDSFQVAGPRTATLENDDRSKFKRAGTPTTKRPKDFPFFFSSQVLLGSTIIDSLSLSRDKNRVNTLRKDRMDWG